MVWSRRSSVVGKFSAHSVLRRKSRPFRQSEQEPGLTGADAARYTWRVAVSRRRQTVTANHGLPKIEVASPSSSGEYSDVKDLRAVAVTA